MNVFLLSGPKEVKVDPNHSLYFAHINLEKHLQKLFHFQYKISILNKLYPLSCFPLLTLNKWGIGFQIN